MKERDKGCNRMPQRNKKRIDLKKKKFINILASLLLVMVVIIGTFYLLKESNESDLVKIIEDEPTEVPIEETKNTLPEVVEEPEEQVELKEKDVETSKPPKIEVEEVENDFSAIIVKANQSVFTIYTDLEQGSGFLINSFGDILTNAHVLKDASYVTVKNSSGKEFTGRVIGISDQKDVALVRVAELQNKQALAVEMRPASIGTKVIALGSPGNKPNTSSEGEITSVGKTIIDEYSYSNLYELNALIEKGSSGGPLINAKTGKVLGINSIVLKNNPGIGYAIPLYTINDLINTWANSPQIPKNIEEEPVQHVDEAYLDEELLKSFISDYYELFLFGLNDPNSTYYLSYIVANSQAAVVETNNIVEFRGMSKIYDGVSNEVISVTINEIDALVNSKATFTFKDTQSNETKTFSREAQFTVIIDQYGDYQIKEIVIK